MQTPTPHSIEAFRYMFDARVGGNTNAFKVMAQGDHPQPVIYIPLNQLELAEARQVQQLLDLSEIDYSYKPHSKNFGAPAFVLPHSPQVEELLDTAKVLPNHKLRGLMKDSAISGTGFFRDLTAMDNALRGAAIEEFRTAVSKKRGTQKPALELEKIPAVSFEDRRGKELDKAARFIINIAQRPSPKNRELAYTVNMEGIAQDLRKDAIAIVMATLQKHIGGARRPWALMRNDRTATHFEFIIPATAEAGFQAFQEKARTSLPGESGPLFDGDDLNPSATRFREQVRRDVIHGGMDRIIVRDS